MILLLSISKKKQDFETALLFYEKIKAIDDTLNKQTYLQQLNSTKFEYQTLQQQDKLANQDQELSNQKKIQILLIIGVFMFLGFDICFMENNQVTEK